MSSSNPTRNCICGSPLKLKTLEDRVDGNWECDGPCNDGYFKCDCPCNGAICDYAIYYCVNCDVDICQDCNSTGLPTDRLLGKRHLAPFASQNESLAADQVCQLLHQVEWTPSMEERKTVVNRWLGIIQQFPTLSLRDYKYESPPSVFFFERGMECSPLVTLLRAGVGLASVRQLCELCPNLPDLLSSQDRLGKCPMHYACCYSDEEVIHYLASVNPPGSPTMATPDQYGLLPFHLAMLNAHDISLDTIMFLLDYVPDTEDTDDWNSTWTMALQTVYPTELLDAIVERLPPPEHMVIDMDTDRCNNVPSCYGEALNLGQARAICRLFPKLQSITIRCYLPGWEFDAMQYLLTDLQSDTNLHKVQGLQLPNGLNAQEHRDLLQSVQSCLERNTTLRALTFDLGEEDEMLVWNSWMQGVNLSLAANQTLDSLRLDSSFCQVGYTAPSRLAKFEYKNEGVPNGSTTSLHFTGYDLLSQDFAQRLNQAPRNLTCLQLERILPAADTAESVPALVAFLARAPALQTLEINYNIDPFPIFEALRTHESLQTFTVDCAGQWTDPRIQEGRQREQVKTACLELVQENSVLNSCLPWQNWDARIEYYLALNYYGRSTVRNATNGQVFIELLDRNFINRAMSNEVLKNASIMETNMTYGLLREVPSLWCHKYT